MGFYAPAQLVRDARDHGVEVRPVDVNHSDPDHLLEDLVTPDSRTGLKTAVRLGLRIVKGLKAEAAGRITLAKPEGGYRTVQELARRAELNQATLRVLADADAFGTMGLSRRQALWSARAVEPEPLPLLPLQKRAPTLSATTALRPDRGTGNRAARNDHRREVVADYQRL